MDAFRHHHHPLRPIGPPGAGDPPPSQNQPQSPFWYPSSSPPPPPGGFYTHPPHQQHNYHHHLPFPPPRPQQQWELDGDPHLHHLQPPPPPHPTAPPPPYQSHPAVVPYPVPHRYPPPPLPHHVPSPLHPYPSDYPHPPRAWGSTYWAQNQGWDNPERNLLYNNEQDWAARAREWATAKPATGSHHSPSQFGPVGRMDDHNYGYHDRSQEAVGPPPDISQPSLPQFNDQQLPDTKEDHLRRISSFTSGSSYSTVGIVRYNAEDEPLSSNKDYMASPKKTYGPSSSLYEQEVPYIYSSPAAGNREPVIYNESSPLPLPLPSVQRGFLQSQSALPHRNISIEQPHFAHGGQYNKPLIDASDLPLNFEPRSASELGTNEKISYGYVDPAVSMGGMDHAIISTAIHSWNPSVASGVVVSQFPFTPSGAQFDPSFVSQPPLPVHNGPAFGISAPNFQPTIPSVTAPFGLGAGASGHASVFPGEGNGTFNFSEKPKKAPVPNWLREQIIKNKPVITLATSTSPGGNSFESLGSEDADRSFRTANQADSKSVDSSKSNEDEEDDEDDVAAARSAAINQEIKRVLTEVLLKVTDELFDEIATKVLNENDLSIEVDESAASGNHKVPSPPTLPTPKSSAKVVLQIKKNDDSSSENSTPNSPRGNVLGLANYASDDDDGGDDETKYSCLLTPGVIVGASTKQDRDDRSSEAVFQEVEKGNTVVDSQEPSLGLHVMGDERNIMGVNGVPGNLIVRNKEEKCMIGTASRSGEDLYHEKAPKEGPGISVVGEKEKKVPAQSPKVVRPKEPRKGSTTGIANNGKSMSGASIIIESKNILGVSGSPDKKSNSRDIVKQAKAGVGKMVPKGSDLNDSIVHDDRILKRKMDKRDNSKETLEERGVKQGTEVKDAGSSSTYKHDSVKDGRKETLKDKRDNNKEVGDRKRELSKDRNEDQSLRVMKNTRSSPSPPSSRSRKSKEYSSFGHASTSSDEPSRNSKKSKLQSNRTSLSPSPTRSRKRQVSRSPPSKHSHRRHSPHSSMERRRRSRSRSPDNWRSAHKR